MTEDPLAWTRRGPAEDRDGWQPSQNTLVGQMLERNCRNLVWAYEDTGNPLYAWDALGAWTIAQRTTEQDASCGFEMPEALMLFLMRTSSSINALSGGLPPVRYANGKMVRDASNIEYGLSHAEKLALVPEALELRGERWNAFADRDADQQTARLVSVFDEARQSGASYSNAMLRVMEEAGLSDERTARRRLKGGRGIRQTPPWRRPTGAE